MIKKLWFLIPIALVLSGATSVAVTINRCTSGSPAIIGWTGVGFTCLPLPTGWAFGGTSAAPTLIAPAASGPLWSVETVSLASLASTATQISYTTLKTPITGVVLWSYASTNLFLESGGSVVYLASPITFSLPIGWSTTDSISLTYQYQ